MTVDRLVNAKREINYNGDWKEPGEVFSLDGCRNDELLLRHRQLSEVVEPLEDLYRCDCGGGRAFLTERHLWAHQNGRHHPRSPNWEGEDSRTHGPNPERRVEPLYARTGGPVPIRT